MSMAARYRDLGAYALVFGLFLLALAFRLRGRRRLIAHPT
jgi:hypothetical protein